MYLGKYLASMRPNIDVPWSMHGRIKDYAKSEEKTLESAYIEVLEEGLEKMPLPVDPDVELTTDSMRATEFGPRVFPISNEESRDINDICTFLPRPETPLQPSVFKSNRRGIPMDEFRDSLVRFLKQDTNIYQDWFTIHQLGGAWVGRDIGNFYHTIQNFQERFQQANFSTYKTGFGVYIAEFGQSEHMLVFTELNRHTGEIDDLYIGFLTDGTPIDSSLYKRIIAQFGMTKLGNAKQRNHQYISYTPESRYEVDVVERITKPDEMSSSEEEWVSGLVIKNPVHEEKEIYDGLKACLENSSEERWDPNPPRQLETYEHAFVSLKNHHPVSEDRDYELISLSAYDYSPVIGRQSIWNLSINANW